MSSLPALCNICCICLEHLLLQGREAGRTQPLEERRSETRKKVCENEEKGVHIPGGGRGEEGSRGGSHAQRGAQGGRRTGSEDVMMDVTNGRAQLPPSQAQVPSTLTQVYLAVLGAFLSREPGERGRNDKPKTKRPAQRWRLSRALHILTPCHTTDTTYIKNY